MGLKESRKEKIEKEMEGEDIPFGPPARMYNYQCSKCGFKSEINEAHIDVAYGWTKKRTRTLDGEIVPVMECFKCKNYVSFKILEL